MSLGGHAFDAGRKRSLNRYWSIFFCMLGRVLRRLLYICVAIAAIPIATGCGDADDSSGATSSAASDSRETSISGEAIEVLERGYKIFSRPRRKSDEIPAGLVPPATVKRLGLDLENSLFSRTYKHARIYIVPSRPVTCLFGEVKAISFCWNTWTAANGYAASTVLCGQGLDKSKVATFGIAHSLVRRVTIVEANGARLTVPVRNNVFVGETSSKQPPPLRIEWAVNGQRVKHPIRDSFKVPQDGC